MTSPPPSVKLRFTFPQEMAQPTRADLDGGWATEVVERKLCGERFLTGPLNKYWKDIINEGQIESVITYKSKHFASVT